MNSTTAAICVALGIGGVAFGIYSGMDASNTRTEAEARQVQADSTIKALLTENTILAHDELLNRAALDTARATMLHPEIIEHALSHMDLLPDSMLFRILSRRAGR